MIAREMSKTAKRRAREFPVLTITGTFSTSDNGNSANPTAIGFAALGSCPSVFFTLQTLSRP